MPAQPPSDPPAPSDHDPPTRRQSTVHDVSLFVGTVSTAQKALNLSFSTFPTSKAAEPAHRWLTKDAYKTTCKR